MSSVQVFSSLSKEERRKVMEDGTRMYGGRTEDRTAFKSIEEQQKVPLLLFFSKFFFFFYGNGVFFLHIEGTEKGGGTRGRKDRKTWEGERIT